MLRCLSALLLVLTAAAAQAPQKASPVIDEQSRRVDEPPPFKGTGKSTVFRISDAIPESAVEFRRRVLYPDATIGLHQMDHDEAFYVVSGEGVLTLGGNLIRVSAGKLAYLRRGDMVAVRQVGSAPLSVIITYPRPLAKP